jgi:hypothetical protein
MSAKQRSRIMTKQPPAPQTDRPPAPSPNVRLSPPPPALMRLLNPLVRRVLSSRHLGGRIDQIMLLEFTGRRSGRRIRVPVALHLIDGVPMAFTHRPWRLNFTGGAPVTITHRGQNRQGRGVLLPATPEQVGSALRMALDGGTSPFVLGLKIARSHEPTTQELASVGHSLIRFDLETV